MILAQELVGKVKEHFDLNVYETKVWLALLSKGIASVGEIATLSRVPRSRVYDVLENLEKKGFAIIRMGKPVKYLGVRPQAILERIKSDVRKTAEEKVSDLSKLRDTDEFLKLDELYKTGINPVKREELSSALKGKSAISNFLKDIIKNSQKEVIICTNAQEINSKAKLFSQTIAILKKANINVKVALSGDEKLIKEISEKLAVKIKRIDIDAKFFIVDRREILFYITKGLDKDAVTKDGKIKEDIAIWLNSNFFAESFAVLFEKAIGEK